MRNSAPPILESKSRNQLSYHTKECRCCGRMITATDQHPTFGKGICHHCKRGLVAADEIGLDQGKAVEAIRYYAHLYSGKEKAAVYHNQTWTVRFETYFKGNDMPEKVDRCSCCGRTGLTLRNKYNGKYVCSTCDYHLRKGRPFREVGQQIGKGRFQDMSKRGKCGCCEREDLTLTRKVNGVYVCGSCNYYIRKEVPFEEVRKKMQTKFPVKGEEPEKPMEPTKPCDRADCYKYSKMSTRHCLAAIPGRMLSETCYFVPASNAEPEPVHEEKHQVNVTPEVDIIQTKKRNRKDPPMMRLPITEREQPVLDWIDKLARENRRFRNDQAWVILEWAMEQMEGAQDA